MTEIPDPVLEELAQVKEAGDVYIASKKETRAYASEQGFDELVAFIDRSDDATYHEALVALPD